MNSLAFRALLRYATLPSVSTKVLLSLTLLSAFILIVTQSKFAVIAWAAGMSVLFLYDYLKEKANYRCQKRIKVEILHNRNPYDIDGTLYVQLPIMLRDTMQAEITQVPLLLAGQTDPSVKGMLLAWRLTNGF